MRDEIWQERRAALETCAYMGMSIKEAAADVGCCVSTVKVYQQRYGIKFTDRRGRKPLDAGELRVKLQPLADDGLTMAEAADRLSVNYATLVRYAHVSGVQFRRAVDGNDPARAEAMAAMYKAGKTLAEIGEIYGLTRERVRQIISKLHRLSAGDGGAAVRSKIDRDRRRAAREAECYRRHGCSTKQLRELRKIGRDMMAAGVSRERTPLGAFSRQKCSATRHRGIEWKLLFWEWWTIWQQSGHWEDRGRGHGYMMCRFGDAGAYEVGNVYIATGIHNGAIQPNNPYRKDHPDFAETMAKMAKRGKSNVGRPRTRTKNPGLPVGVTAHKNRYVAQACGKYLGCFGTPEEAQARYLQEVASVYEAAA